MGKPPSWSATENLCSLATQEHLDMDTGQPAPSLQSICTGKLSFGALHPSQPPPTLSPQSSAGPNTQLPIPYHTLPYRYLNFKNLKAIKTCQNRQALKISALNHKFLDKHKTEFEHTAA